MKKPSFKKKGLVFVLTGAIAFSTMGGTAYAYKDSWTPLIQSSIDKIYLKLVPEIKKETDEKEKEVNNKLTNGIEDYIKGVKANLTGRKDELIKQNKEELDRYYEDTMWRIKQNGDQITDAERAELEKAARKELQDSKNSIDENVEKQLEKYANVKN